MASLVSIMYFPLRVASADWLVHNRNVCDLLNVIAPCHVKEFKDAALEYICLNLEDLLTNG